MSVDPRKELIRVARNLADGCDIVEFRKLVTRFGDDAEMMAVIQKAVRERESREDSGSWRESASPGWGLVCQKQKVLDEYYLNQGPSSAFGKSAKKAAGEDKIDQLLEKIDQLTERVGALERGQMAKYRLKP